MNGEEKVKALEQKYWALRKAACPSGGDYRFDAPYTPEMKRLQDEINCRSMMISFFAYSGVQNISDESSWDFRRYLTQYVKTLGRRKFNAIRKDMLKTFEKATVRHNVFTDSEGCSYNSIDWGE